MVSMFYNSTSHMQVLTLSVEPLLFSYFVVMLTTNLGINEHCKTKIRTVDKYYSISLFLAHTMLFIIMQK